MSTDKGESDLDVFNDLKPHTPDGIPIIDTKKTLMGIPVPDGGSVNPQVGNTSVATPRAPALGSALSSAPPLPPVPGSSSATTRSVPPPPPSQRPRRSGAPPLPPP